MSDEKKTEKPNDPYQRYKDFKWENPDQFKNGPIDDESRKCRDCICCFIFILIFLLCIVVAVFGFIKGKPAQLFYFYDEDGNACGYDKGYENFPFLYFTNVIGGITTFNTDKLIKGVCVSECPNEVLDPAIYKNTATKYRLPCKGTKGNPNCEIEYEDYYESKSLLRRLCFPKSNDEIKYDPSKQYLAHIYDPNTGETFKKVINNEDTVKRTITIGGEEKIFIAQDAIKYLFFKKSIK